MKLAVVLVAGFFAVAHAGVGVLTPQGEAEALQLFAKICGTRSEGGNEGGVNVWCKFAPGENIEVVDHQVIVPAQTVPDNIVFIQPPPTEYKHNVQLTGSAGAGGQTKIYVLPQKSSHSITSQYTGGEIVNSKPTVYFLKSDGNSLPPRYGSPGVGGYAK